VTTGQSCHLYVPDLVLVKANTAFSIAFFAKVFFGNLNAWKILNDITGCGRTR
jgi:hypothetical protein